MRESRVLLDHDRWEEQRRDQQVQNRDWLSGDDQENYVYDSADFRQWLHYHKSSQWCGRNGQKLKMCLVLQN